MLRQKNNPERLQKLTEPRFKRQLSVFYKAPDGRLTSDDPNSYTGEERVAYQNALLNQYGWTGYADGILAERKKNLAFLLLKRKKVVMNA
ncbi:hypothetical protein [Legionella bozemanae]|uniref:hypothetical protein n=1 Tax=Legionella bozemanae TaxID=447 RepID=UPI00216B2065|nr:hypothetical protein [Legionella bozemanae]